MRLRCNHSYIKISIVCNFKDTIYTFYKNVLRLKNSFLLFLLLYYEWVCCKKNFSNINGERGKMYFLFMFFVNDLEIESAIKSVED